MIKIRLTNVKCGNCDFPITDRNAFTHGSFVCGNCGTECLLDKIMLEFTPEEVEDEGILDEIADVGILDIIDMLGGLNGEEKC